MRIVPCLIGRRGVHRADAVVGDITQQFVSDEKTPALRVHGYFSSVEIQISRIQKYLSGWHSNYPRIVLKLTLLIALS